MIRTQVFLTKDEVRFLETEAKKRKVTKSEVVRQAVDRELGIQHVSKKELLEAFQKSIGLCKGMNLKKKIKELRERW